MKRTLPFISRAGGKSLLLKHLLPLVPSDARCYVEGFGGGAALLFAKPRVPKQAEVYNDTDEELSNAFLQVRQHPAALVETLKGMLCSRRDLEKMKVAELRQLTEIQRAAFFIWRNRISFGGDGESFAVSKSQPLNSNARCIDLVEAASERLDRVAVECLPWERLVKTYDSASTFFFFDPPYLASSQKVYRTWDFGQWTELAESAENIKGRALITSSDHPKIRKLFSGWEVKKVTRKNSLRKNKGGSRADYGELIISMKS